MLDSKSTAFCSHRHFYRDGQSTSGTQRSPGRPHCGWKDGQKMILLWMIKPNHLIGRLLKSNKPPPPQTESPQIQAKNCIKKTKHIKKPTDWTWIIGIENENISVQKYGSIEQPVSAAHFCRQLSLQLFVPPLFHYLSQQSHLVPEQHDQTTSTQDIKSTFMPTISTENENDFL